jgi:hypothetical protein
VLIASAVMTLFSLAVYNLFFSGAKTAAVGMWRSKSNQELRNGIRLIREDLARATYPSVVTDGGTLWPDRENHHCTMVSGRTEAGLDAPVLSFFICTPELNVAGVAKAGEKTNCQLKVEGNNLRYLREGTMTMDKIVVSDLEYIDISSEVSSENVEKNNVTIEIGTIHPLYKNVKVVEKTVAKVEVEVE